MLKDIIERVNGTPVVVMDSLSQVDGGDDGSIVVSGSHAGYMAGVVGADYDLRAVFLNDAGVGKEDAGIRGLEVLAAKGVPAGTVSHDSARIGLALDTWQDGVISHVNAVARAAGFNPGDKLDDAVRRVFG